MNINTSIMRCALLLALCVVVCGASSEPVRDVPYIEDGTSRQKLDLYAPEGDAPKGGRPVMVYIHGGGWSIGDRSRVQEKPAFFNDHGWVFVSAGYRLSPQVVHPEHVKDIASAIAWVHRHIADHGGDPQRIFIMGHSAGAHLAALVATDESRLAEYGLPLSTIRGVVLLDGAGYDLSSEGRVVGGRLTDMYDQAFTSDPSVQQDASPIHHVEPGKGIPPFLVTHIQSRRGSKLMSERLAQRLTDAGVEAAVYSAEGETHGSINQSFGTQGHATTDTVMQWLDR